jgi:hypothetical protein
MSENELGKATSPYLLQHRDNPVHWRLWGEAALAEAKRTGRPILLSVGYAACHWCHVMAHESFEDAETAALMNELFVSIKVDREERPDIDEVYMASLHAMGQRGGWPLTMFLTPEGEPFWGGTYFPKEARYGRPSFRQVLQQIADAYRSQPDRIKANVETLRGALRQADHVTTTGEITLAFVDDYATRLAAAMDNVNGGFQGAPKFPNASLLELLWRSGDRMNRPDFQEIVLLTLRRICAGGIHDHLGGGFARYAVDERWLVPHFEKMLYDNAQLLDLLALAFQKTGEDTFRDAAAQIVAWLDREMRMQGGAFSASLDADSEGVEGKFYVWTKAEIIEVLGADDGEFFSRHYDVDAAGNWTDEHTGVRTTILNRLAGIAASPTDEARLAPLREKLLERRNGRVRPGLDDKILADWNGLMIAALVDAGIVFHEQSWIGLAQSAFDFIADSMSRDDTHSRLGHSFRDGRLLWPGMASDHANMMRAALALAEASSGQPSARYLAFAEQWAAVLDARHLDPATGVLTTAADDSRDVVIRTISTGDDASPNANAVYASALLRMAALTGKDEWRERADRLIAAVAPRALAEPDRHAALMNALDFRLRGVEIRIVGPQPESLAQAALSIPFLNRTVRVIDPQNPAPSDESLLAEELSRPRAQAAAFICAGERCSLPITQASEIASRVRDMLAEGA